MNDEVLKSGVLRSISNNLMVDDVDKTLAYYTSLGFRIVHKSPEAGPAYWAFVKKDQVELFFQSRASLVEEFSELESYERGGSLTLWFRVDNISQWYEEIKDKTEIIRPFGITPYNGAKEFVVIDLNGFILHFSDYDILKEINKRQTESKE